MKLKGLWLVFSLLVLPVIVKSEHENLQKQLRETIAGKNAQVGIAVILNGKDTITVNIVKKRSCLSKRLFIFDDPI